MKKIISLSIIASALLFTSCKKDLAELNDIKTSPLAVTSGSLFANASRNMANTMASTNVNVNNFRLFSQQWTETVYRDETRYNLNGRSIPDRWWATFYRDIIKDLAEASKVMDGETGVLSAEAIKNRKAINDLMTCYSYYILITTFGDVPYSEALNIENIQPKYDKASDIFDALAIKLDAALGQLDENADGYGSADLIMAGDIAGWKRFGNCLKMRMGMLIADVNAAKAATMVTEAAPNVISDNSENIVMNYLSAPPNTNPVWEDLIQSGRFDFVAAKPFVDVLNSLSDPRRPHFFGTNSNGDYVGQRPGSRVSNYTLFSGPSTKVSDPMAIHTIFSYSEMELLKAEAVERGISVGGTAEDHYNEGVRASILEWGGSLLEANTYLAQPNVAYTTATGNYKEKIGVQSWLALYNRGYDAWTQWRRLDYPQLQLPFMGAVSPWDVDETPDVIKRMTYPVIEQNLNKTNYAAAAASIGKDWLTQKLWFDVN